MSRIREGCEIESRTLYNEIDVRSPFFVPCHYSAGTTIPGAGCIVVGRLLLLPRQDGQYIPFITGADIGAVKKATTSHLKNVILSPSHVILSVAKNLFLFAQDKLREGSLNGQVETLRSRKSAPSE
jgi:hypothetical protein